MKKLIYLSLSILILSAACKKKKDDDGTPAKTPKGGIEFTAFIKDFSTEVKIKGVGIKLGTSYANIDNNVLIASYLTDSLGKAKTGDLDQATYYFKASYTDASSNVFTSEGAINVVDGQTYLKNISLKQTAGKATLTFYAVYPPAMADSVAKNANVSIDYNFTNLTGTPMATGKTGNDGRVVFNNLNADTVWARFVTTIGSKSIDYSTGVMIPANDLNQQYRIVLK